MARATRTASSPPKVQRTVHQLKITLEDSHPPIWRRVQVPSVMTLQDLHAVIQLAFGWTDSHLHEFQIHGQRYTMSDPDLDFDDLGGIDEDSVKLSSILAKGARGRYTYDFGDGWDHLILVEDVVPVDPNVAYPVCLTGKNACPPEDCGGIPGYYEMLEQLADPNHSERESWLTWLGGDFDPKAFSLEESNELLSSLRPRVGGRKPRGSTGKTS
jgi:hypothetical protein